MVIFVQNMTYRKNLMRNRDPHRQGGITLIGHLLMCMPGLKILPPSAIMTSLILPLSEFILPPSAILTSIILPLSAIHFTTECNSDFHHFAT